MRPPVDHTRDQGIRVPRWLTVLLAAPLQEARSPPQHVDAGQPPHSPSASGIDPFRLAATSDRYLTALTSRGRIARGQGLLEQGRTPNESEFDRPARSGGGPSGRGPARA